MPEAERQRWGEIVSTSTIGFISECEELHCIPPLGSLVLVHGVQGERIFAVVAYGETSSIDPGRRIIRRGRQGLSDAALYEQNPELKHILRSLFHAVAVGYEANGVIHHVLPSLPPPLHYSVEVATSDDVVQFTARPRYFSILAHYTGEVPTDQLLVAHIRYVFDARGRDRVWLEQAAREIARVFKQDYDRLLPLLESLDPDAL
ncbi:hypothetical protein [Thermorudis peleae]|uniref:hypothetical protein n=1 Tax=Thermorudis peleae TaxID=1382356 RepID=UPI0005707944|nr:hypothetical protein [Thermorudis peleae]MBX6753347.1 hypothetical protein [Thermorudis peleae]